VSFDVDFTIEVASDDIRLEGTPFDGTLAPDQALLLKS
jgi:hypothetical protein